MSNKVTAKRMEDGKEIVKEFPSLRKASKGLKRSTGMITRALRMKQRIDGWILTCDKDYTAYNPRIFGIDQEIAGVKILKPYPDNRLDNVFYDCLHLCCGTRQKLNHHTITEKKRRNATLCSNCAKDERKGKRVKKDAFNGIKGWGLFLGKMGHRYGNDPRK